MDSAYHLHASSRLWVVVGSLAAAIAVGCGALGAHFLEGWLEEHFQDDAARRLELWETASRYLMYHALGLLAVGLYPWVKARRQKIVGVMMLFGMSLFSGCLFAYVFTNVKTLVHVVPLGGMTMILSWVMFAFFALVPAPHRDGAKS
jgi:uncharacterized membrane protein YgdD (TMEM256/DUF423 family)